MCDQNIKHGVVTYTINLITIAVPINISFTEFLFSNKKEEAWNGRYKWNEDIYINEMEWGGGGGKT